MSKRLLSVPEAAEILDLTQKGLWAMVGRRDIETVKVGRLRKIPMVAIEKYIEGRTTPARRQAVAIVPALQPEISSSVGRGGRPLPSRRDWTPLVMERQSAATLSAKRFNRLIKREKAMGQSILRLPQVRLRVGLSRSSIYQKISRQEFPRPVQLGIRSVGWLESEIERWIEERVEHSRGLR